MHAGRRSNKRRITVVIYRSPIIVSLACICSVTCFVLTHERCVAQQIAKPDAISTADSLVDFDLHVAPLLVSHCLECHSGSEVKGGLSLADKTLAAAGGDSGPSIVLGNAEKSLLWERVSSDEMPPKHPLNDAEKTVIKRWIDQGAIWGMSPIDRFAWTTPTRGGRDWWSLQAVNNVTLPPPPPGVAAWGRNEIDTFILNRLAASHLKPSPEATPRSLVRRLYFDLIGLPPTPEQVAAFVAQPTDSAYDALVDELLSSKHYGERWGRHWLDVVRFGESDGFERNFQRENAWPYRDWVIDALNADMPYNEFVQMQLIGDQIKGGLEGAAATGFWVAGVHNTVVGGSKRMQLLARDDEIEEVLATVGQTFVGLTINCARCHDHKFDPITQNEYYQLSSAISGLGFGERVERSTEEASHLGQLEQKLAELQSQLSAIEQVARDTILAARQIDTFKQPDPPPALARWEFDGNLNDSMGSLHGKAVGNLKFENGAVVLDGQSFVETSPIALDITEKTLEVWVELGSLEQRGGAAVSLGNRDGGVFDAIVFGELEAKRWMAGSEGFARSDSFHGEMEDAASTRSVHIAFVYQKDGTIIGYREGKPYGKPIHKNALQTFKAGNAEILFGLRHKPSGGNRFLNAKIHRAAFYDRALTAEEVAISAGNSIDFVSEQQIVGALKDEQRARRDKLKANIAALTTEKIAQVAKANRTVYTLQPQPGKSTNVLLRGDPEMIGDVVAPGSMAAVTTLSADFGLAPDSPEASRRRKLSDWITSDANPLFARVMVNRVWHYHFGIGLVETPNDFGFNGGRPTHPDLLDFLAARFCSEGYRLKSLHRLIVTSSTYRQSTFATQDTARTIAERTDAENRLLWRGSVRRLEAEAIRDSILSVAGQLNTTMGGPSFKDVSVTLNSGTTYYEPIDVDGKDIWRRTVYRFNPRGGRSALLDTFDCPDPSATAPRRSVTTTPLQALSLLNDSFVLRMAEYMAIRVSSEAGDDVMKQVSHAWQLAVMREPTTREMQLSVQLVEQHGLASLCRGLFNSNEFVMIE